MVKKFFGVLFVAVIGIGVLANMKTSSQVEKDIHNEVAADSLKEYELAKKHGDRADVCLRAGLVAEAYLQAKDEENYAKWRDIERADCRRAGLPGM